MQPPPGLSTKAYIQGGEQTPDQTLQLSPLSATINFGDIVIYRIGEGETFGPWSLANWMTLRCVLAETMAPSSALPIGAARVVSEMQPLVVDPAISGSGLYNAILAILAPPNPDESERYDEEILDLPAIGFIAMHVIIPAFGVTRALTTMIYPYRTAMDIPRPAPLNYRRLGREADSHIGIRH